MGKVEEAASFGGDQEIRPVTGEEARMETVKTGAEERARVQVTKDEKDLSQSAHQD